MANDVDILGDYGALFVRVKASVGGNVGGKIYLIPEQSLSQFEFMPLNESEFANALKDKFVNLDFGVYWPDLTLRGSAG